jgi:hypothetical protein
MVKKIIGIAINIKTGKRSQLKGLLVSISGEFIN